MIVIAIIGIISVLGVPFINTARKSAQSKQITNNIRIITDAFNQYAVLENQESVNNITLSDIDDYIEGGLNQLRWPVAAPAITTTRNALSIEFNGKSFTCDHPEGQ